MGLKPYLQLVRLPNLFTAAADPLAGFLIVGGALADTWLWAPLVGAGAAIYAGGMVLNDAFDYRVDLAERPGRPLPSGLISRRSAAWLGTSLLVAGPCLAALSGMSGLVVALVLSLCVLGYDGGLKKTWLGPEIMGTCRSLNLLLGTTIASTLGGPLVWLAAGIFGLFVVGLTWISRDEVHSGLRGGMRWGSALQGLAIACFAGEFLGLYLSGRLPGWRSMGLVPFVLVAYIWNRALNRAWRNPTPATLQAVVKTGVLSLVWLDVALVAAARGPLAATSVAVLWIPAFLLGKWLYST